MDGIAADRFQQIPQGLRVPGRSVVLVIGTEPRGSQQPTTVASVPTPEVLPALPTSPIPSNDRGHSSPSARLRLLANHLGAAGPELLHEQIHRPRLRDPPELAQPAPKRRVLQFGDAPAIEISSRTVSVALRHCSSPSGLVLSRDNGKVSPVLRAAA